MWFVTEDWALHPCLPGWFPSSFTDPQPLTFVLKAPLLLSHWMCVCGCNLSHLNEKGWFLASMLLVNNVKEHTVCMHVCKAYVCMQHTHTCTHLSGLMQLNKCSCCISLTCGLQEKKPYLACHISLGQCCTWITYQGNIFIFHGISEFSLLGMIKRLKCSCPFSGLLSVRSRVAKSARSMQVFWWL